MGYAYRGVAHSKKTTTSQKMHLLGGVEVILIQFKLNGALVMAQYCLIQSVTNKQYINNKQETISTLTIEAKVWLYFGILKLSNVRCFYLFYNDLFQALKRSRDEGADSIDKDYLKNVTIFKIYFHACMELLQLSFISQALKMTSCYQGPVATRDQGLPGTKAVLTWT